MKSIYEYMKSPKFYSTVGKTMPVKTTSKGGMIVGGYVPLLRNTRQVEVEGKGIQSNRIVGIVSKPPSKKALSVESAEIKPTVFQGGELLHKISRPQSKKTQRENIKFIF